MKKDLFETDGGSGNKNPEASGKSSRSKTWAQTQPDERPKSYRPLCAIQNGRKIEIGLRTQFNFG